MLRSLFLFALSVPGIASANGRPFVHLFEWKWSEVAKECRHWLGPKGIRAVQVSPPQEHVVLEGRPWYERYQVVSYRIESRGGSRAEFAAMMRDCARAGVEVYVDAVLNHTTARPPQGQAASGSFGSVFRAYEYPGLYQARDFHRCGRHGDGQIRDWRDRWEIQNCDLLGLSDLATGSAHVRSTLAAYLRDLLGLGASGFRIDAAKHIPARDLEAIYAKVGRPFFAYHESIDDGDHEVVRAAEYFPLGKVLSFKYGADLARVFKRGSLAWLANFGEPWGYPPSAKAVVFLENHDTQRAHVGDGDVLGAKDGDIYRLASLFMLAWPYGQPQILSSYDFTNDAQGPPATTASACAKGWRCEHRLDFVAPLLALREHAGETPVTHWWSDGRNRIAFGRGDRAFVVLNRESSTMSASLPTGLAPGSYRDPLSKRIWRIESDGRLEARVGPRDAIVLAPGLSAPRGPLRR